MQPTLGMFLSKDVWQGDYSRPQSLNAWAYVENSPINYTDPSGYCAEGDTACWQVKDFIEGNFQQRVLIDTPDKCASAENPLIAPVAWTTEELIDVYHGLDTLRKFWNEQGFNELFTPVMFRRSDFNGSPSSTTYYHDPLPVKRTTTPVIVLRNGIFFGEANNSIDTWGRMTLMWGELYHLMDYRLSGSPTGDAINADGSWNGQWLLENGCGALLGRGIQLNPVSVHSFRYAYTAGWTFEQCVAALQNRAPVIDSPANAVVGPNYAGVSPAEDFAHTYQALTEALVAGQEICAPSLCVKASGTYASGPVPSFNIGDQRLWFFLTDALNYGANVIWRNNG